MPNSDRYRQLVARVSQLRRHLLPKTFDLTGSYQSKHYDRAKAFRLIAHAEVESYIEDRVVQVANLAVQRWLSTQTLTACVAALLAFHESKNTPPSSLLNPPQSGPDHLAERLKRAQTALNTYARVTNNGVREQNVLKMFLSVGIDVNGIDLVWLTTLDSWARERGEFAHKAHVQVLNDPKSELDTALDILRGLAKIDSELDSC